MAAPWETMKKQPMAAPWENKQNCELHHRLLKSVALPVREEFCPFPNLRSRTVLLLPFYPGWRGPIDFWALTGFWFGTAYPGLFMFYPFRVVTLVGWWTISKSLIFNWLCYQLCLAPSPSRHGQQAESKISEAKAQHTLTLWQRLGKTNKILDCATKF